MFHHLCVASCDLFAAYYDWSCVVMNFCAVPLEYALPQAPAPARLSILVPSWIVLTFVWGILMANFKEWQEWDWQDCILGLLVGFIFVSVTPIILLVAPFILGGLVVALPGFLLFGTTLWVTTRILEARRNAG